MKLRKPFSAVLIYLLDPLDPGSLFSHQMAVKLYFVGFVHLLTWSPWSKANQNNMKRNKPSNLLNHIHLFPHVFTFLKIPFFKSLKIMITFLAHAFHMFNSNYFTASVAQLAIITRVRPSATETAGGFTGPPGPFSTRVTSRHHPLKAWTIELLFLVGGIPWYTYPSEK